MKKITCILGSPRTNGNTETISRRIISEAEKLGAGYDVFKLNDLSYKGCQGCKRCKKDSIKCVVNDDLTQVLDSAMNSDILIFASPIYFGQLTGQIKMVLDRMYSFLKPTYITEADGSRISKGKKFVLVTSQGNPNPSDFQIFDEMSNWFKFIGYTDCYQIRGLGLNSPNDASKDDNLMNQAAELGKTIME